MHYTFSEAGRTGRIIHTILQAAAEVQVEGITLGLQWVPGHCDDPGNDAGEPTSQRSR